MQLSEEERRRSEAAVQQRFGGTHGVDNVGARLMAKMGFGTAEGSKGGLGRNEHVCLWALNCETADFAD